MSSPTTEEETFADLVSLVCEELDNLSAATGVSPEDLTTSFVGFFESLMAEGKTVGDEDLFDWLDLVVEKMDDSEQESEVSGSQGC